MPLQCEAHNQGTVHSDRRNEAAVQFEHIGSLACVLPLYKSQP